MIVFTESLIQHINPKISSHNHICFEQSSPFIKETFIFIYIRTFSCFGLVSWLICHIKTNKELNVDNVAEVISFSLEWCCEYKSSAVHYPSSLAFSHAADWSLERRDFWPWQENVQIVTDEFLRAVPTTTNRHSL